MQHGSIHSFENILKFERSSGACGQVAARLCQFKGSQGGDWFQQSVELTHGWEISLDSERTFNYLGFLYGEEFSITLSNGK